MDQKKYLDETGLKKFWEKVKAKDTETLNAAKTYSDGKNATTSTTVSNLSQTVAGLQTAVNTTIPATYVNKSLLGVANGVATLDANGTVPAQQLPSYVDDVLEYDGLNAFPRPGETGKIYVDLSTNKTYRWSGSTYVPISDSIALGTTSSTAYPGDKGQANANAILALQTALTGKAAKNGDSNEIFNALKLILGQMTIQEGGIDISNGDSSSSKLWLRSTGEEGIADITISGGSSNGMLELSTSGGDGSHSVILSKDGFKFDGSNVLTESNIEAISTTTIEALS